MCSTVRPPEIRGVSVEDWKRAVLEAYQNNKSAAQSGQIHVDDAVLGLREIDEAARARRRLGPINLSAEEFDKAERNLFLGVRFGDEGQVNADPSALPGEFIKSTQPERRIPNLPPDEGPEDLDWSFSDDD